MGRLSHRGRDDEGEKTDENGQSNDVDKRDGCNPRNVGVLVSPRHDPLQASDCGEQDIREDTGDGEGEEGVAGDVQEQKDGNHAHDHEDHALAVVRRHLDEAAQGGESLFQCSASVSLTRFGNYTTYDRCDLTGIRRVIWKEERGCVARICYPVERYAEPRPTFATRLRHHVQS